MYLFNGTHYNELNDKIVASDAIGQASQGSSVSLDASGSQLLFGGFNDNGKCHIMSYVAIIENFSSTDASVSANVGAAWIYKDITIG
jgi:hypothetical protein